MKQILVIRSDIRYLNTRDYLDVRTVNDFTLVINYKFKGISVIK